MYDFLGASEAAPVQQQSVDFGENWSDTLRMVAAYGLSRAIDSQFAEPFQASASTRYGVDQFGRPYILGESAPMPTVTNSGGVTLSPSLIILAVIGFLMLS